MRYSFTFGLLLTFLRCSGQDADPVAVAEALRSWLPSAVGEYMLTGEPYASVLLNKGKPYPVASKRYTRQGSDLMIFIADYRDHDVAAQQIKAWASGPAFDDDKKVGGSIIIQGCPAWRSYSKQDNGAILYLVVKERYLLTLTVSQGGADFLTSIAEGLDLKKLP